jgi:hypothetical protein
MVSVSGVPQTKLKTDKLNPKLTLLLPHTIIVSVSGVPAPSTNRKELSNVNVTGGEGPLQPIAPPYAGVSLRSAQVSKEA